VGSGKWVCDAKHSKKKILFFFLTKVKKSHIFASVNNDLKLKTILTINSESIMYQLMRQKYLSNFNLFLKRSTFNVQRPLQPFKIFQQRLLPQHKRQNTFTLIYDSFVILSIYAFYVFNTLNALLRRVFSLSYTARIPRRRGNRELYSWFYRRFLYNGEAVC
jgi:hypothetical protein